MKNRDTILLEEAYNKTRLLKEERVNDFNDRKMKEDRLYRQDQQAIDQADTEVAPDLRSPEIDPETEEMYWSAFEKLKTGEISTQQWGDICAKILGDLFNKHNKES